MEWYVVQGYSLSGSSLVPCAHKTDDKLRDEDNNLFAALETAIVPFCCKDGSMAIRSPNKEEMEAIMLTALLRPRKGLR